MLVSKAATYHECELHDIFHVSIMQYKLFGEEMVSMLDGMFSFVLLDTRDNTFIAARDPIGITPLYVGWGTDGMDEFSNIIKKIISTIF